MDIVAALGGTLHLSQFPIVIPIALIAGLISVWRRRSTTVAQDGPLLAAQGMLTNTGLQSLSQGTVAGFSYNLLTNDSGRVMVSISLNRNTYAHIIAYGNKSRFADDHATDLITPKWLEPASLEGDFPDYFHMYCSPGMQIELRQLFTPDVMANFIDFCQSYDFEIYHDTLYMSQAAQAIDPDDETTIMTDVTDFLTQHAGLLSRL